MNIDNPDFHSLRNYLLGQITDETILESIEINMLADRAFLSEVERVEAELIEEYITEMMNSEEKKNFQSRFLAAPERREKFRFMLALNEHASERFVREEKARQAAEKDAPKARRGVFSHDLANWTVFRFVSFAALVVIAGVGIWAYLGSGSGVNSGLASLNSAYSKQRPTDARLSPFDYAPAANTRGSEPAQVDANAKTKAGILLIDEAEKHPGADSLHALGLYYATQHDFQNALNQFVKGSQFNPSDAKFFGDYGAVLLETARNGHDVPAETKIRHLDNSLAKLNLALKIDSNLLPALFNKALCLEEMKSFSAAGEAWQKYIEKDPGSKWAKEAQEHLTLLEEKKIEAKSPPQVLDDFLQAYDRQDEAAAWKIAGESKEMVTGTMVSEQLTRGLLSADAQKAPDSADRMTSALSFLGKLEKENSGDIFFSELAAYYRRATPEQRIKLAQAQDLNLAGYQLINASRLAEAKEKFTKARELFAGAGDEWEAAKTDYWIAYSLSGGDNMESLNASLALAESSRERSYKWLLSLALLQASTCYIRQSNYSPAIKITKEALRIAENTGDAYSRQKAAAQLANCYNLINDAAGAVESSQISLSARGAYFNSPRQIWRNYVFAAQVASQFGMPETAIAYGQESVRLSEEVLQTAPEFRHNSFLFLSRAYQANNDLENAFIAAEESRRSALLAGSVDEQDRLLSLSFLQKGEIERLFSRCADAVENYSNAINLFDAAKSIETVNYYNAKKGRLLCQSELGNENAVDEGLGSVLSLAEKLRSKIEEENARTSFFAGKQNIYEFAAVHALKNNRTEAAFDYVESGKARSLLDELNKKDKASLPASALTLPLAEIRRRMPARAQLVQYAVLPDKLLIWIVTDSDLKLVQKDISSAELETKVSELMSLASRVGTAPERMGEVQSELYSLLIAPIKPLIDSNKTLVIVPDKSLCYLPFDVLRPAGGNYLLEDSQLAYAPSATLFITLSEKSIKRSSQVRGNESFLGVGNPSFDHAQNPGLPDLPAAEREIKTASGFYSKKQSFLGDDALKDKIVAALPDADIFHYAGHFKANELSPRFSKFLLAGRSDTGENDLTADDIGKLKLNKTKLVILSACQTAIENFYDGEGAIGVARTFFAAGAPAVVASRWDVDSNATAKLMTAFHRYRKLKGLSTPAALRAAQLELLKSGKDDFASPYYWGSFAAIGGV
jgi:CHAT domain-containing protein